MTTDVINGVPRDLLERIYSILDNYVTHMTPGEEELRELLATAQPAADGEREAFEAEISEHREGADLSRKPDGSYSNYYLECVWQGFQMRAAPTPGASDGKGGEK